MGSRSREFFTVENADDQNKIGIRHTGYYQIHLNIEFGKFNCRAFCVTFYSALGCNVSILPLDRALHDSITINFRSYSYRLKDKLKAGLVRTEELAAIN